MTRLIRIPIFVLLLLVGLGVGVGYLLCNLPWLFNASAEVQAATAGLLCLAGAGVTFFPMQPQPEETPAAPQNPISFPRVLACFTALVWLDSAAFFIIQKTPALKSATWEGSIHLSANGALHLLAALASVWLLRRRGLLFVLSASFLALGIACLLLLDPQRIAWASIFYPIGVSLYSVALVAYPALLGPATSRTPTATGTPATSFNVLLRQLVGNSSTTAVETVNVSVTGTTNFLLPPRYAIFATALPFTPSFTASTIFAGQHVAVVTSGVTSGASTANTVVLQPQTITGAITNISTSGGYNVYTVTLPAGHWLATLTGQTTVLVYTNSLVVPLTSTTPAVSTTMRFNGYLFNVGGTLRLLACGQAGAPGISII